MISLSGFIVVVYFPISLMVGSSDRVCLW